MVNVTVNVGDIYDAEKKIREIGNNLKNIMNKSVSDAHAVNMGWTGTNSDAWIAKFDEFKPKILKMCEAILTMADGLKKSADILSELQNQTDTRIQSLGSGSSTKMMTTRDSISPNIAITSVSDTFESTDKNFDLSYKEGQIFKAQSYGSDYTDEEFIQLAAIVGGEDSGSYEGALAVASTMCNRADAGSWGGIDPLTVAKAENQYVAYNGDLYNKYMADPSSMPDYVIQATKDALNGTRNTTANSFRAVPSNEGDRIQIGNNGNYFFSV